MNNPTVNALEAAVAALETGAWAVAAATGMAAINAVLYSLLSQGDRLLAGDCLYGPSHTVIARELPRFGIATAFVDTSDLEQLKQALADHPKLLFLETPTNPTMKLTELAAALPPGPGRWRPVGGRQHLCHSLQPASPGIRHRPGGSQPHQGPEWPQRRPGGHDCGSGPGPV